MRNIDNIIQKFKEVVQRHYLGNGAYSNWIFQDENNSRDMGINPYGCADAMNILYMLNEFPTGEEREAAKKALQSLQNPDNGLFEEPSHHFIHTTAHCIAALDLFDAKPLYPQKTMLQYFTEGGIKGLLDSIRWETAPWRDSHMGAGAYVIGTLTDNVDLDWQNYFFQLIYDATDPEFGMSREGTLDESIKPIYHHLFGWFHYMFTMQYARRPLKYPERLVDTCIWLYDEKKLREDFGIKVDFAEVDWVYSLNRATRETPHRFYEAKERLRDFAGKYLDFLENLDFEQAEHIYTIHAFLGALCCVAELQIALPGEIVSTKPLRPVLERRPFI